MRIYSKSLPRQKFLVDDASFKTIFAYNFLFHIIKIKNHTAKRFSNVSLYDLFLYLFSYDLIFVTELIIGTVGKLSFYKSVHFVLVQIFGADVIIVFFIIYIVHACFAIYQRELPSLLF